VASVLLAIPVGQAFNGTPLPLLGGVMAFSSLALVLIMLVRKKPH
jgi:DHA1 family bicyclomycin/chloramphenicol resistance-like MFS transporter